MERPGLVRGSFLGALLLSALACSPADEGRGGQPLAPGGAGGSGPPQVPPPVVHAPPEHLAAELLGPELGAPPDVRDISVDAGGGVWIAAADGLFVRPPGAHFLHQLGRSDGVPPAALAAVGGLGSGVAVVSFRGGEPPRVVRLRAGGGAIAEELALSPLVARVRTVDTEAGRIAVLATGAGLATLDAEGRILGTRSLPPPAVELWDVALTAGFDAWVADPERLTLIAGPVTSTIGGPVVATADLLPEAPDDVVAVEVCPDGTVWASSLGAGLFRLSPDGRALEQHTSEDVLPQDHLPTLACDLDGSLWIGSSWGGIARRLPDGTVRYHSASAGLAGDGIRRLLVVPDGAGGRTLWIATDGGALWYTGN